MLRTSLVLFLLLLTKPFGAIANHAAGGEIYYQWISDSTYRFFVKFYRDCSSDPEPSTMPLCFKNTCNNSGFAVTMSKYSSTGVPSQLFCTKYKTQCDSPQSTYIGITTWTYSAVVTMPARCSLWKIFTYASHRSASANLSNTTSTGFYIEATLNNQAAQGNSSPQFTTPPVNYVCVNNPVSISDSAADPDNDSLVYQVINPLTGVSACTDIAYNASFVNGSYFIPGNPIASGTTFLINSTSGIMTFTPTANGVFTLTIKISEYRNNILVGTVMRDMPIQVASCSFPTVPSWSLDSMSGGWGGVSGRMDGCVGTTLHFCYHFAAPNPDVHYIISDNLAIAIPAATMIYTGQGTDTVNACLTWTPTLNDSGLHGFILFFKDSTCVPIGGPLYYTSTIPIYIQSSIRLGPDTGVCPNGSITLVAVGEPAYTWAILPGGSPNSLSCLACPNPLAYPTIPTQYEVTGSICGFKDTILVGQLPFTYPSFSITASDTNAWPWLNVHFTAHPVNCNNPSYQWILNGIPVPDATSDTWDVTTLSDNDKVSCILTCKDPCPVPRDTQSNIFTMHIPLSVHDLSSSKDITVYPNPNNGNFTTKLYETANGTAEITDITGRTVYKKTINSNLVNINLPAVTNGLYLLKLRTVDGIYTKLFSVNR